MITILAATWYEAEPTLQRLREAQIPVEAWEVGIGPLRAADFAARASGLHLEDSWVVHLGTAGTFGAFKRPRLVTPRWVTWKPTGERLGLSKTFPDLFPDWEMYHTFDLPQVHCLTSTSVSLCGGGDLAVRADGGSDLEAVENMELYALAPSVAHLCREFRSVLAVTNEVGPNASEDWRRHWRQAAQMTADYLVTWARTVVASPRSERN